MKLLYVKAEDKESSDGWEFGHLGNESCPFVTSLGLAATSLILRLSLLTAQYSLQQHRMFIVGSTACELETQACGSRRMIIVRILYLLLAK